MKLHEQRVETFFFANFYQSYLFSLHQMVSNPEAVPQPCQRCILYTYLASLWKHLICFSFAKGMAVLLRYILPSQASTPFHSTYYEMGPG